MQNLGKLSGTTEASIKNRIQAMEESISGITDTIEEIDTPVKENANIQNNIKNFKEKRSSNR